MAPFTSFNSGLLSRAAHILRITALVMLGAFSSCRQPTPRAITPAFYFWKTSFSMAPSEQRRLDSLGVRKIYLRLADIDLDQAGRPVPIGALKGSGLPDSSSLRFVPTIFITARTLPRLRPADLEPLAKNILRMVSSYCVAQGISPAEIQIDCDWAAGTKDVYFDLLRALKAQPYMQGRLLSCTIRLHQDRKSVV